MKLHVLREPERWSERGGGTAVEDVIGASFEQIRATTQPSDAVVARWARRAMAAPSPRAAGGRVWSVAIAVAILAGGGAVGARVAWRAAVTNVPAPRPPADPMAVAAAHPRARARQEPPPAPLPDPAPALEVPVQAPPAPLPAARRIARAPRPVPDRAPRTEPPPIPAAEADDESSLVARAFRHLRSEGDATAALAALDEHQQRFGAGALVGEAALARAEALLLLGRTADALPILLALRGARAGLTSEVRAVRAELLARGKRCAEATADFDALLAPGVPAATRERALYGRASCRLQGARPDDAESDLERYLAEFPRGRFAPSVREALEKLRRP